MTSTCINKGIEKILDKLNKIKKSITNPLERDTTNKEMSQS